MNTIRVDLSYDQLKQALLQLPPQEKMAFWRLLDQNIDRAAITERFDAAVKTIRKEYAHISEDEIMADATEATREVRAARRHAKNRP